MSKYMSRRCIESCAIEIALRSKILIQNSKIFSSLTFYIQDWPIPKNQIRRPSKDIHFHTFNINLDQFNCFLPVDLIKTNKLDSLFVFFDFL
ncbi:hypothetical protein D9M68_671420 [compost metagenome]